MKTTLIAGLVLGAAYTVLNVAIALLNRPSDWSVAGGYLVLVGLAAGIAELVRRWTHGKRGSR